ncbi:NUDIX hydrolase [Nocardia iowensis]|uniref:CoA pyrophosphatase n=1 Tax=Nocardia iowensis TaxID=204891 RepID=A0ABX8RNR2_NOCIO|nr:CoA pyrophosphatase [Nocardia iowensis]QXN90060.1 CoA pyrophosphatase [Nocardia iowensis]
MCPTTGPFVSGTVDDFRLLARTRLNAFPHTEVPDAPGIRRAAVLLCVVGQREGSPAVVVIKRAYRGRNAGQWGLPGGRLDEGETAEQAVLRELHEELGLTATPADLLGRLDDFPAASGFVITPFVAALPDAAELRPSPAEVHSVHLVELARLAADDVPHWVAPHAARRQPELGDAAAATIPEEVGLLQMRLGDGMTIHAPTGAMLWQFREVVLLGRDHAAVRVAHFTQPDWTQH